MFPKRARCPGASSAVAFLLALGLAVAAAAAEYTLHPSIGVEQSFDDNVLAADNFAGDHLGGTPSREISSWNTNISPMLALDRKTDTNTTRLEAGFTRRKTYSLSDLDGTDEHYLASTRQVLSSRFSVGALGSYDLYAAYNAIIEPLAGGQPIILNGERPELIRRVLETDLTYRLNDTTQLTTRLSYQQDEYGSSPLPRPPLFVPPPPAVVPLFGNDYLNTTDRSVSLSVSHRLSQTDSLGLHGSFGLTEERSADTTYFNPSIETENRLGTLLAFWERNWSARLSTTLQAGGRILDTEGTVARAALRQPPPPCALFLPLPGACPVHLSDSDSGSGFVGNALAEYAYSRRGTLSLSISRDTRTGVSSATGSTAIDIDTYAATVTHGLSSGIL